MNLTETWILVSSTSAIVQKQGSSNVRLKYSAGVPTDDTNAYGLPHNDLAIFPESTGLSLYARAVKDAAVISFNEVS